MWWLLTAGETEPNRIISRFELVWLQLYIQLELVLCLRCDDEKLRDVLHGTLLILHVQLLMIKVYHHVLLEARAPKVLLAFFGGTEVRRRVLETVFVPDHDLSELCLEELFTRDESTVLVFGVKTLQVERRHVSYLILPSC